MTVGPRSKGDYQSSGGWASHVVAPQTGLRRLPDYLSYDQGASFLANFETAYFALVKRANIQAGETVLITRGHRAHRVWLWCKSQNYWVQW